MPVAVPAVLDARLRVRLRELVDVRADDLVQVDRPPLQRERLVKKYQKIARRA